jgi:hypothetical protein
VAVADFNNDGNLDLIMANYASADATVLLGDGTGNFSAPQSYATGPYCHGVTVADFNNDGFADAATVNVLSGDLSVLINDGYWYGAESNQPVVGSFALHEAGTLDSAASASSSALVQPAQAKASLMPGSVDQAFTGDSTENHPVTSSSLHHDLLPARMPTHTGLENDLSSTPVEL